MSKPAFRIGFPAGLAVLALLLGACGSGSSATATPTSEATAEPTTAATEASTSAATATPTAPVTEAPTSAPNESPTAAATATPTAVPTEAPTSEATAAPTSVATQAPTSAPTEEPEKLFDGITVSDFFASNCSVCHGSNREGLIGPPLLPERLVEDDAYYINTILNGRPGTVMPVWGQNGVSPEEAQALVAFLRTAP